MNHLKAISSNEETMRVGNYMVLFGGKDLVGEFFTPQTDFKSQYTDLGSLYVDFEHGQDPDGMGNDKNNVLGLVDWKSAKFDQQGIYVERILNRRADYMKFVDVLLLAGVLGTSSQAIPGQSTRKSNGEIIEWPLMRDSLTVTPMEPRMAGENVLTAAKSLASVFPSSKSLSVLTGVTGFEQSKSIKSISEISDLATAEDYLRDAGGLSRKEAKTFISTFKSLVLRNAAPDNSAELKAIALLLEKRKAIFA